MTADYYLQVNGMTEDDLYKEVERLTKALYKMNGSSAVYDQVQQMLNMAQDALNDKMYLRKYKDKNQDEALEIGTISSQVNTPDYNDEELLTAVVTSYVSELRDKDE
jgi:hypothetical protein